MARAALIDINMQTLVDLARHDPSLGHAFDIKTFLDTTRPSWVPPYNRRAKGVTRLHPEYTAMNDRWEAALDAALLQHKAAMKGEMTSSEVKKVTTRCRAVELRALQEGGLPVKLLLSIFWHKNNKRISVATSASK